MHIKVTRSRRNRHHTILREREPPTLFFLPPSILSFSWLFSCYSFLYISKEPLQEKKKLC